MEFIKQPMAIENKSFEIIAPYLPKNLSAEEIKIYSRIIHAAGDVDYSNIIKISSGAIESGLNAIRAGKNIYTDVEMVRTGINKRELKKYGGEVFCKIADDDVKIFAEREKITRAMAAMRMFGESLNDSIIAIGNAPTALFEVLGMEIKPALIIGVPVGFVGAADSKEALANQNKIPFITVSGTKGGSSIAVAAVNALIYLLGRD